MVNFANNLLNRVLNRVEWVGNKLPDPVTLFVLACVVLVLLSAVAANLDVGVSHPVSAGTINTVNLLSGEIAQRLLVEMPQTFAGFAPLGLVLLIMMGIGVADKSGLIAAALKMFIAKVPQRFLSLAVVFAGILSSLAADVGYVVLIPLSAVVFLSCGRHPLAGLAAGFAGVSAGYSANLVLTAIDPLLAGLTEEAAQIIDEQYQVLPTANYYLMVAFVPVLTLLGAWVTDRLIEPRLQQHRISREVSVSAEAVNATERRAVWLTGLVCLVLLLLVAALVLPANGVLRDAKGALIPFYKSVVAILFVIFLLCGLVYGWLVGKVRSDRDLVKMMADSMADMGHYIVLAFFAAHLIVLFKWSNLGVIIAVNGAEGLKALGLSGSFLLLGFMAVVAVINIFIGSASAKWALIAPVFVPMMMLLGYPPELTQAAYRVGDSVTNILTPLMPYFPLVIVFAKKYVPELGIGTLVAMMLPYSIAFAVGASLTLLFWFGIGWPLGPGI